MWHFNTLLAQASLKCTPCSQCRCSPSLVQPGATISIKLLDGSIIPLLSGESRHGLMVDDRPQLQLPLNTVMTFAVLKYTRGQWSAGSMLYFHLCQHHHQCNHLGLSSTPCIDKHISLLPFTEIVVCPREGVHVMLGVKWSVCQVRLKLLTVAAAGQSTQPANKPT